MITAFHLPFMSSLLNLTNSAVNLNLDHEHPGHMHVECDLTKTARKLARAFH